MKKIYLNILGIKNFRTEDLEQIHSEIKNFKIDFGSILYEPFQNLKFKIKREIVKRERSKFVWVEFTSYWSGYTSSQRKLVGQFYRKIEREKAKKLPNYFCHHFTDNTTNDWSVKIVDVKGKDTGSYEQQIDEFLEKTNNYEKNIN